MTITAADVAKFGYYDSVTGKVHTGTRMGIGHGTGWHFYWGQEYPFINVIKGSAVGNNTADPGDVDSNGYIDCSTSGGFQLLTHGNGRWIQAATAGTPWVLRWTGTSPVTWGSGVDGITETDASDLLVASQDETSYDNSPTTEGTFAGGASHSASDVITMASGATITVDAVSTGAVTEFTVTTVGSGDQTAGVADTQSSTTGSGTGFSITPDDDNIARRKEYSSTVDVASNNVLAVVSSGTLSNIELLAPGDEAIYDSGKRLNSTMLTDLSGLSTLRVMNWQAVNDSAPQVDWTDFMPYDYMNYNYPPTGTGAHTYNQDVPIRECCLAANELECNLWITVPHQMTDAAMTSMANEINTYYTVSGGFVYVEYSNECWNSAYEQTHWVQYLDATLHNATFTYTTATASETSHGLSTGEELACYSTMAHNDYPYAGGGPVLAIVDDANTFRVTNNRPTSIFLTDKKDITAVTNANPCQVTIVGHPFATSDTVRIADITGAAGLQTLLNDNDFTITVVDVDNFTLDSTDSTSSGSYTSGGIGIEDAIQADFNVPTSLVSELRYHVKSEASLARGVNYGTKCVEVWDLFGAVLGTSMKKVIGCFVGAAGSWVDDVVTVTRIREADYWAMGAYYRATDMTSPTTFANATPAQITEYMKTTEHIQLTGFYDDNMAFVDTPTFINYECGNHQGPYADAEEQAAGQTWWDAADGAGAFYAWYWKALASTGYIESVHFHHTDTPSLTGHFNWMNHLGDTDSQEAINTKIYMDVGGAPKL